MDAVWMTMEHEHRMLARWGGETLGPSSAGDFFFFLRGGLHGGNTTSCWVDDGTGDGAVLTLSMS